MFLEPSRQLNKGEARDLEDELLRELDTVAERVRGGSVSPHHQPGWTSVAPKDKAIRKKARPLLSYAQHGGHDLYSAAGRAGIFVVKKLGFSEVVATDIKDVVSK